MQREPELTHSNEFVISRRSFLAGTVSAFAAVGRVGAVLGAGSNEPENRGVKAAGNKKSAMAARVLTAEDAVMVPSRVIQMALLRDTFNRGLATYFRVPDVASAWRNLLDDDDRVLIKFNQSASELMGTSPAMAMVVVESLLKADIRPERMTLMEVDPKVEREFKLRPADFRWQGQQVQFGDLGKDVFRADVDWATAIINVPFLKTHHMAVMTACLKNLSHGLIRHPARFHGNRCEPGIAAINASDNLKSKVKLNIINGLRVNYDRGPEASERDIESRGWLAISTDPVAADRVGFAYLNKLRAEKGLKPLMASPDIPLAQQLATQSGLGESVIERIELVSLEES